jgi:hypothetical protein
MLYLAEFYLASGASLPDLVDRASAGARQVARQGNAVRLTMAIFMPADESCFVLYEAGSINAVLAAGAAAQVTFDRVAEAVTMPGG